MTSEPNESSESANFGGLSRRSVVCALWLIFAGLLVTFISFGVAFGMQHHRTTPQEPANYGLQITDQPLGDLLIAAGIVLLARAGLEEDFRNFMLVILGVLVLDIASKTIAAFPVSSDPGIEVSRILINFLMIGVWITFGKCMQWFCEDTRLGLSARQWRRTTVVFIVSGVIIGLLDLGALLVLLKLLNVTYYSSSPTGFVWSWLIVLIVVPIFAQLMAIFMATLQMQREMLPSIARSSRITVPNLNPVVPPPPPPEATDESVAIAPPSEAEQARPAQAEPGT